MDKQQKAKHKKKLLDLREDILKKVKNIHKDYLNKSPQNASGNLSGHSFHLADLASDNFEREVLLGLAENERSMLIEIDRALRRLKDKDFGKCSDCGERIRLKRLIALPYALMCITCQEEADKKSK